MLMKWFQIGIPEKGTYTENVSLVANRIIPDYYNDKSILEKILTIKSLMD